MAGGASSLITANNSNNNFGTSLNLTSPSSGPLVIVSANNLALGIVNDTNPLATLSITALNGSITQTAATSIIAGGTSSFTADNGSITLNNAGNNLTGTVSFNTLPTDIGSVSFTNSTGINLGTSSLGAGTFSVTATTGNITQAGPIIQAAAAGAVTFSVLSSSGAITLNNAGNTLTGSVSFSAPVADNGNVVFKNSTAVTLGSSVLGTGTFSVTATTGNILENGTITQAASAGVATFTLGSGTLVDLATHAVQNLFTGPVVIAGSHITTIDVEDFNSAATLASITLPAAAPLQNVSLTFDNPAASITFPAASNFNYNFTLTVTGNIVLPSASSLAVAGNLTLDSTAGNLNLPGTITVTGATSTTSLLVGGAASSITANNTADNFGTSLNLTNPGSGADIILSANGLALGMVNISNALASLSVTTKNGAITQTATTTLTVAGNSTFTATNGSIDLNATANFFGGVIAASATATGANITIDGGNAANNLILGNLAEGNGTLTITNTGSAAGAGILQQLVPPTSITTVGGSAVFSVSSPNGVITLNNAGNNITGSVSFNLPTNNTGNVAFTNSTAINLGSSSLGTGTFSVTATNGNILENGTITQAAGAGTATFTLTAGTLIDLATSASKNVFTGQVVLVGNNITTVAVEDYNPTASLASITLPTSALQSVTLIFDNPDDSIVLPVSGSFNYNFSLTASDDIVLPVNASLMVAGNLILFSTDNDLELFGTIDVTGAASTTTLLVGGASSIITAHNSKNNFGASLSLTNPGTGPTNVQSAGSLVLGNVDNTNVIPTLIVTAGGPITQSGTILVQGNSSFTTSSGSITLSASGNVFGGMISVSVNAAGSDTVTIDGVGSAGNLILGTIILGTGTLGVTNTGTAVGDGIQEGTQAGISTAATSTATLTFTVDSTKADILLFEEPNSLPAGVVVDLVGVAAGTTGSVGLRNTLATATLSQFVISHFTTLVNETIEFDDAPIPLASPINITGILSLTALGPITQAAAATITAGSGLFTVLGTSSAITLTNAGNNLAGPVSFLTPVTDTGNVSFTNSNVITLGNSSLGTGTFSVTAISGTIAETSGSAITQAAGAGAVKLTAHSNISLDNTSNIFTGTITATTVNSNIILGNSNSVTTLGTIALGTGNLQVDDFDASGTSSITEDPTFNGISMSGTTATAVFNVVNDTAATVDLSTAPNNFAPTVSVTINGDPTTGDFGFRNVNSGATTGQLHFNNYSIHSLTVEFDATSIDVSTLPPFSTSGNLTVIAGGNISQSSGVLTTSGTATFTVLGNTSTIALNDANVLTGTISLNSPATDTGNVSFTNSVGITLGSSSLGTGTFSVTATTGNIQETGTITQAAGAGKATFTLTAGTLIDLATSASKNFFTGPLVIVGGNIATVAVEDYYPSASIPTVSVPAITLPTSALSKVSFTFDNPVASVLFPATNTFNYNYSVTTTNDIVLAAGSTLIVTGNLTLDSTAGDLDLLGKITVNGATSTTTLAVGKGNITANGANSFGASLNVLNGGTGTYNITSSGSLALGNVSDAASSTLNITAGGAITQAASTSLDILGSSSFTTSTGSITLATSGNIFGAAISASVSKTGSDTVTIKGVGSTGNLILGTIILGTGTLSVTNTGTATGDGIQEGSLAGISSAATTGTLTFTVSAAQADILLFEEPNNLPAGVVVDLVGVSAGTTGSIGLRNTNSAAALSQMVPSHFTSVTNETIEFDTTSISLASPITITGILSLTAGGSITQTAGITSGGGSFSVLNDFGITLTGTNNVTGAVSFSDPNGDKTAAVTFTNNGAILLGSSSLGLGTFSVAATGANGTITEVIPSSGTPTKITQALGAGAVTLTAGGNTIALVPLVLGSNTATDNDFSGPVTLSGTSNSLSTIAFENSDGLATLPVLKQEASSLTEVTVILDNVPVALPTFTTTTITTLNVEAGGNITQQTGASLVVSGNATFRTGAFAILLANSTNNFNEVSLTNSGENAVSLATKNGLVIDDWKLGSGPVLVTAGGPVSEAPVTTDTTGIQQTLEMNDAVAGSVTLGAGTNSIVLDNTSNAILGPITVTTSGSSGNVTVVNNAPIVLGTDTIGGVFTLTANGITQAPGTSFAVTGNGVFTSNLANLTLTNAGNTIGGTIGLKTTSGYVPANATIIVSGPAKMAASNVQGVLSVTAGGAITQSSGTLVAQGASFTASGGSSITLTNASNDFHSIVTSGSPAVTTYYPVSLSTSGTGTASLTDSDTNGLALGTITFGSGALTLVASTTIMQDPTSSSITGSGPVTISAGIPASPISVVLNSASNSITGTGSFALNNVTGVVSIDNQGGIALTGGSTIASTADVTLVAGGSVTLPNGTAGTLTLDSLSVSANQITVSQNLTTTNTSVQGMSFTGSVSFTSQVALTVGAGSISFNGNVTTTKPLIFNLAGLGSNLNFSGGTWTQGSNNLTINGTSANFDIGTTATTPTVFIMSGGTLTLSGEPGGNGAPSILNAVNVNAGGTLQVTGNVILSDGGTYSIVKLNFNSGSLFSASLGKTPGSLSLNGLNASDKITIGSGALLSGSGGLASTTPQSILSISGGGSVAGSFANLGDSSGDFLMGTDIVQATYTNSGLTVVSAGTAAPGGTVSGIEPDGDGYTVALSGSGTLVVLPLDSGLEIVVRNDTTASTLTITTTANGSDNSFGDTFTGDENTAVDDIVFDGIGSATINAPTTDVSGNITIAGPLTAMTLHDWTSGTLTAGGTSGQKTTINGNVFGGVTINLPTQLNNLTVVAAGELGTNPIAANITAASFGTINATGDVTQFIPGDFNATLVNTTPGVAVLSAMIGSNTAGGTLSGNWELTGSVGSVTANSTASWNLGVPNGPGVANGDKLTKVSMLNLGAATLVSLDVTGVVTTLTAESLNDLSGTTVQGVLQAGSFGTIQTTGQPANQTPITDHGDLIAHIIATGTSSGPGIGSLSVAGNLGTTVKDANGNAVESTVLSENGNITGITVNGAIEQVTLDAMTTTSGGTIGNLLAARIDQSTIEAKILTTLSVVGNLAANIFGDFNNSSLTITGPAVSTKSPSLGAFSTSRNISNSTITVEDGSVGSITVGQGGSTAVGKLSNSTITLESASVGDLGAISAAEWDSSNLTARTITTLTVSVRPAAAVSTKALYGNVTNSTIIAFAPIVTTNPTPGITTFSVAGALSATSAAENYLLVNNGISSFSVGRNVSKYQVSTDLDGGTGGIANLTAGEWDSSDLSAYSLAR